MTARRWRPAARRAAPRPPLPDNPYRRFFTPRRTFEELVQRKRERQERQEKEEKAAALRK